MPAIETVIESRGSVGTIFNCALLHKFLETRDITAAATFANAAAATSLAKPGDFTAIPTLDEVSAFYSKYSSDI